MKTQCNMMVRFVSLLVLFTGAEIVSGKHHSEAQRSLAEVKDVIREGLTEAEKDLVPLQRKVEKMGQDFDDTSKKIKQDYARGVEMINRFAVRQLKALHAAKEKRKEFLARVKRDGPLGIKKKLEEAAANVKQSMTKKLSDAGEKVKAYLNDRASDVMKRVKSRDTFEQAHPPADDLAKKN